MLSLVDIGYAAALQFDEATGACTINREAMLGLVEAKASASSDSLKDAFTQEYNVLKHNLEMKYITEKQYTMLCRD